MYSNKLVACVKANGKTLREKGEQVFLPFGCEYTLWFKNEHTRKVQITVEIDGTDVLFDKALLLGPGETMDLKGFVRDTYDSDENRAFRFIEKTDQISEFRGDKVEDGLIKVMYQFERERPNFEHIVRPAVQEHHYHHHHHRDYYHLPRTPFPGPYCGTSDSTVRTKGMGQARGATLGASNSVHDGVPASFSCNVSDTLGGDFDGAVAASAQCTDSVNLSMDSFNDAGINVEGQATGQSFQQGHIGALERQKYTMVFQLKGIDHNVEVAKPVTVQLKKKCSTCGKSWKSSFEYCPNDGTFLRV